MIDFFNKYRYQLTGGVLQIAIKQIYCQCFQIFLNFFSTQLPFIILFFCYSFNSAITVVSSIHPNNAVD